MIDKLQQLSKTEIAKLMQVSEKLAETTYKRFTDFRYQGYIFDPAGSSADNFVFVNRERPTENT